MTVDQELWVGGCGLKAMGWRLQVVLQKGRRRWKVGRGRKAAQDGDEDSHGELKRALEA
jgi:hypothetical protein